MFVHSPRAFPLGVTAPVGTLHSTQCHSRLPRARRPRPRICLRKGCGRKYLPRRWNQRYCQDPECLREVRRWLAARRQAKRRQDPGVKAQQALAQKQRRQRAKVAPKAMANPDVAPARGHAAENFFRALLRSARLLRTPREFAPQPGSLLLCHLPPSRSQCPGPRTQVARTRHVGWPHQAGHRIPGRMPQPIAASPDHRR